MGSDRTGPSSARRRLTVLEASEALGITPDAVRGRVRRKSLRSERDEDGRMFVFVESTDRPRTSRPSRPSSDQSELIETLREALAAEREANRENRRIIAALTQRIPELEAPPEHASEPREAPSEAATRSDRGDVPDNQERRSWWRSFFGVGE